MHGLSEDATSIQASSSTSSSKLLLAILALCLGLAAFWFFGTGGATEDWVEVAYAESQGLVSAAEIAAGSEASDPEDPRETGEDSGELPAPLRQRHSDGGDYKVIDPAHGFPVRVVSQASGGIIASASVRYYDTIPPSYLKFRKLNGLYQLDREVALMRAGEQVRTDDEGIAILPHGIPTQHIVVRHGPLYGELQVSTKQGPPQGGYLVELLPDRIMRVQIVDSEDQPVTGVHMVFHILIRGQPGGPRWVMFRDENRKTNSPDGIQVLTHVQKNIELLRNLSKGNPIVHFGLDIPGLTRCGPAIDMNNIPEEIIKIVKPVTGRVRVQVKDADGEPVQRRVRLSAEVDFDYPHLKNLPAKYAALRPSWVQQTDEQGVAVFDTVATGKVYRVASLGKNVGDGESVEFNGPRATAGEVTVPLFKDFSAAWVSGVAYGEDGAALTEVTLNYQALSPLLGPDTEYLTSGQLRTDQRGGFSIRLPPPVMMLDESEKPAKGNLYRGVLLTLTGASAGRVPAGGTFPLPQPLQTQRYTVGAVQLRQPRLLAAGRVFLDDRPMEYFDRVRLEFKNPANRGRWERLSGVRLYAFKGGRFEIRGEDRNRELRMRVRTWGYLPMQSIPFGVGDKDLAVRLYRSGSVRVAVLHDRQISAAQIEVRLRPVQIEQPPGIEYLLKWQFIGRVDTRSSGNQLYRKVYWWTGLPPGKYRIELRLLGANKPFEVIEDLQPHFGVPMQEIEPEVINLRDRIRRFRIRAVDARSRPLSGLVVPLDQTAEVGVEGLAMGPKGALVYATRPSQDVMVFVRGYRPETVYSVSRDHLVRMQPGIPITVTLPSMKLPKGVGVAVRIRRKYKGKHKTFKVGLRHPVVARSRARYLPDLVGERTVVLRYRGRRQYKTTLMEHGQFSLYLQLVCKGKEPVRMRSYGPSILMIRDTSVEHKFTIKVSTRRLRESLESMGFKQPKPATSKQRKQAKKSKSRK